MFDRALMCLIFRHVVTGRPQRRGLAAAKWFASGDFVAKMGPFGAEEAAWEALKRAVRAPPDEQHNAFTRRVPDARVWPEW